MGKDSFHVVTLGCAKNIVDSESMAQLMAGSGYLFTESPETADVLDELAATKRPDQILIAAGCLTQRYGREIANQVPGIDGILGTRRWMDIVSVVQKLRDSDHPEPLYHLPDTATVGSDERGAYRFAIQGASAYIKIADGCRRPCAFCAIPLIKGTAISRR